MSGVQRMSSFLVLTLLTTLMTVVPASAASGSTAQSGERYDVVLHDDMFVYVIDTVENTKVWADHCKDQLSPRAVVWADIADIPQGQTPSCGELALSLIHI